MKTNEKKHEITEHTKTTNENTLLNPEALISQAIEQKVSIETLESLLKMRQELKKEFAKEQYDTAIAQLQMNMPIIKKTKSVKTNSGTIAYKYAPLEDIVLQVKDILEKYGFSYSVTTKTNDGDTVTSIVEAKHKCGHSEISTMTVPIGTKTAMMNNTQVVASALTFAKRYAFCNVFGIMTGETDTDGKCIDTQATAPVQHKSPVETSSYEQDIVCLGLKKSGCGNNITQQEKAYSERLYGKALCRSCQSDATPI